MQAGAHAVSPWIQSLLDINIVKQKEAGQHMFDVCDDGEEWILKPLSRSEDSSQGNFILFKFQWAAGQEFDTVGTAEAT